MSGSALAKIERGITRLMELLLEYRTIKQNIQNVNVLHTEFYFLQFMALCTILTCIEQEFVVLEYEEEALYIHFTQSL